MLGVDGLVYVWPTRHQSSRKTCLRNSLRVGWVLRYQRCLSVYYFSSPNYPSKYNLCFKKNEPTPTLKASIRLLRLIFMTSMGAEFQRQVVVPNLPKFAAAIVGLAEKHHDEELKVVTDLPYSCGPFFIHFDRVLFSRASRVLFRYIPPFIDLCIQPCLRYLCVS